MIPSYFFEEFVTAWLVNYTNNFTSKKGNVLKITFVRYKEFWDIIKRFYFDPYFAAIHKDAQSIDFLPWFQTKYYETVSI